MNNVIAYKPKISCFYLLFFLFIFLSSDFGFAGDLNLAWDASPSSDVGGYKLYYGQTSKAYTSNIDVGKTTNYRISGLNDGATYFFALKAYNTAKSIESSFSNEVRATVAAASSLVANFTPSQTSGTAPLIVTFKPNSTGVILGWRWTFGTSSIPDATVQTPTVTFTKQGVYNVVLTAIGANGTTTTSTKQIVVTAPAPANAPKQTPITIKAPVVATTNQPSAPQAQAVNTISVPPPVPVAAYGFEEKQGNLARDSSGHGNHGLIRQAKRIKAGRFGKVLKFDGVDDWVTVRSSDSLNLSTGYTLEAWIKPLSIRRGSIIVKQQSKGSVYDLYAYEDSDLPFHPLMTGPVIAAFLA